MPAGFRHPLLYSGRKCRHDEVLSGTACRPEKYLMPVLCSSSLVVLQSFSRVAGIIVATDVISIIVGEMISPRDPP